MNFKRLEVFVAVAETGSFSRAAEVAFITQSTVSQHILALEDECGLKLLNRTGKGVFPTEAGKIVLAHARRILGEAAQLTVVLKRFRGLEEASLCIGASNIPGTYIVPEMLSAFVDRFPGVTVNVRHADTTDVLDMIKNEEVEIGIIGSRLDADWCDFTPFGLDRLVLAVSASHPHAGDRWTVEKVIGEPYISRERGSGTEKTVVEALSSVGVDMRRWRPKMSLGSNEAVKRAVVSGIGVSFLSETSVKDEVARGDIVIVSIDGLDITRPFFLATRAKSELSPAATTFRRILFGKVDLPVS